MKSYIVKRIFYLVPILLGVSCLSFALMQISSVDFVDMMANHQSGVLSQEAILVKKAELGLDKPYLEQYMTWLYNIIQGDMGQSFVYNQSVFSLLFSKFPNTLLLTFSSLLLTLCLSLPLGFFWALRPQGWWDVFFKSFCFLFSSLPSFILAFLLIYLFAVKLHLLPLISIKKSFLSMVLPSLSLALVMSSKYIRQIRTLVSEEMQKDYIVGLRSRGISSRHIMVKSVLKSSMIGILTLVSLSMGSLLGGTAIIESIFMWDGMGKMAMEAVMVKDYPVVQIYVLFMAVLYLLINLVCDILYYYLDPRIKYGDKYNE